METEQIIVGLIFVALGGVHAIWPRESFKYRAMLYKKFYGAEVKASERTYKIYRIYGILFLLIGLAFFL